MTVFNTKGPGYSKTTVLSQ